MTAHHVFGCRGLRRPNRLGDGLVFLNGAAPIPVVSIHAKQVEVAVGLFEGLNDRLVLGRFKNCAVKAAVVGNQGVL